MDMLTKALFRRSSTDMEAECASYWCSVDAFCEESVMIASLQSLLWSSSDFDLIPGLCSSNVPYSLPGSSPFCINDNEKSTLVSSTPNEVLDTLALAHGEKVAGSKRKAETDEEKNHGGEGRTTPLAPRARKQSKANSQSCYAKQMRRERINARLKILQELIPNGKKVDISTMLDEAVQYVKFLHMQIKLLSSDEMWMYAPLAYDSVNIGIPLCSSVQE
ncbi:hypothetical protein SETIT_3G354400v2 [Setaria italica]|uniref:BHLH domain-containing protein n=1 Tax=Setaria italica TaxID=4555 RepID=A0A368QM59_SETIT|nr:transcription factor bHLH54 isoform X1 [Setaria italica]RCV19069.1 hypothetical protein SETIT_3G354400v2 [Setaria italica]